MELVRLHKIEEWFDRKETEHLIQDAIEALPLRQKTYQLNRNENKSYKEIAEELNISPSNYGGSTYV